MSSSAPLVRLLGHQRARRARRLLLAAIGLLYVLSVPWYRETGSGYEIVFGLPDWVAVALGCYIGVAVLNAFAWQLTEIDDPDEREIDSTQPGGPL